MSSTRRTLLIGGGIVIVIAATIAWWFGRPAPAEVDIAAAIDDAATAANPTDGTTSATPPTGDATAAAATDPAPPSTTTSDGTTTPAADGAALEGREWTISTEVVAFDFDGPAGTFTGFRIDEELSSIGETTAVARTPVVSGALTLSESVVTDATFTADLTALVSDRRQRNAAIQRALHTDTSPEATFTLSEPIELGAVPPVGEAIEAEASGTLTINGVTQDVTMPLQAALVEPEQLVVTTSFEVSLADYDIEAPSAPAVVSVADTATIEAQLYLVP